MPISRPGPRVPPTMNEMPGRVLVADDTRHVAFFLTRTLQRAGYEVREVHSGDAVLPAVEDFRPQAVILDVEMPGMTGVEICRALRGDDQHRGMVILFATSHTCDRVASEVREAGADGQFPKPVSPSSLLGKLRELEVLPP